MKKKDSAIIRKREAEVAQRLSPSWNGQDPKPVLSPEVISYEVSEKTGAVSYGGLGLLQQVVKWSGLGKAIDQAVTLLKRHQPYHESDHVLSLIYNVATGGTRYQDIELRRQSVSFLEAVGAEKIPAPSTAGDFVRRFDAPDVVDLMEAVNASRLKVWAQQPARFFQRAEIDVDGTMAPTSGECKEGMEISYDGQWGYAPLIVTLANTGEVLYAVNRSGNRPSHEGAARMAGSEYRAGSRGGFSEGAPARGHGFFADGSF